MTGPCNLVTWCVNVCGLRRRYDISSNAGEIYRSSVAAGNTDPKVAADSALSLYFFIYAGGEMPAPCKCSPSHHLRPLFHLLGWPSCRPALPNTSPCVSQLLCCRQCCGLADRGVPAQPPPLHPAGRMGQRGSAAPHALVSLHPLGQCCRLQGEGGRDRGPAGALSKPHLTKRPSAAARAVCTVCHCAHLLRPAARARLSSGCPQATRALYLTTACFSAIWVPVTPLVFLDIGERGAHTLERRWVLDSPR